jgi:1,4-dihydroxy-2-naphthoate octaprenyltransferase
VLAGCIGVVVALRSTPILFVPGLLGATLALFYSEKPIGYKYKGVGEIGVFLAYGPVITFSCVFSLAQKFDLNDLLFSMPFGLFSAAVLLANNIRDYQFDLHRTTTLTTLFGSKISYAVLFFIVHLGLFFVPILVFARALPKLSLLTLCSCPLLFLSIKKLDQPRLIDAFGIMHVSYCLLLSLAFLLDASAPHNAPPF